MVSFTSARERRLWAWAVAAVVAIYATIPVARPLLSLFPDRATLDDTFFAIAMLLFAAIVLYGLRTRPRLAELAVWVGVLSVYSLMLLRMEVPAERTHLVEYGVVAIVVHAALRERADNGGGPRRPGVVAAAIAGSAGLLDEAIQSLVPSRVFDLRDVGFNLLAATVAIASGAVLRRVRRRDRPATG